MIHDTLPYDTIPYLLYVSRVNFHKCMFPLRTLRIVIPNSWGMTLYAGYEIDIELINKFNRRIQTLRNLEIAGGDTLRYSTL